MSAKNTSGENINHPVKHVSGRPLRPRGLAFSAEDAAPGSVSAEPKTSDAHPHQDSDAMDVRRPAEKEDVKACDMHQNHDNDVSGTSVIVDDEKEGTTCVSTGKPASNRTVDVDDRLQSDETEGQNATGVLVVGQNSLAGVGSWADNQ